MWKIELLFDWICNSLNLTLHIVNKGEPKSLYKTLVLLARFIIIIIIIWVKNASSLCKIQNQVCGAEECASGNIYTRIREKIITYAFSYQGRDKKIIYYSI